MFCLSVIVKNCWPCCRCFMVVLRVMTGNLKLGLLRLNLEWAGACHQRSCHILQLALDRLHTPIPRCHATVQALSIAKRPCTYHCLQGHEPVTRSSPSTCAILVVGKSVSYCRAADHDVAETFTGFKIRFTRIATCRACKGMSLAPQQHLHFSPGDLRRKLCSCQQCVHLVHRLHRH